MSPALWFCLLCMQCYLLTHALDCTDGGTDCATAKITKVKSRSPRHINPEQERASHHNQINLPGSFTAKGSPNLLIPFQADRPKGNLNGYKRKQKQQRSRSGSYSLLSNKLGISSQILIARGHAELDDDPAMTSLKEETLREPRLSGGVLFLEGPVGINSVGQPCTDC